MNFSPEGIQSALSYIAWRRTVEELDHKGIPVPGFSVRDMEPIFRALTLPEMAVLGAAVTGRGPQFAVDYVERGVFG